MAGTECNSRRCFGFGVETVSKVGPSMPRPPSPEGSVQGNQVPVLDTSSKWDAAMISGVVSVVVVILGLIVVLIILRRRMRMRNSAAENGVKGVQGEEEENKEGQWCAGAVELVVMAGETQPTFLAHPVPTPTNHPIQCPPLILPNDLHPGLS